MPPRAEILAPPRPVQGWAGWTLEQCAVTLLLPLFVTHFYVPVLEPVQTSLFAGASDDQTALGRWIAVSIWAVAGTLMLRQYGAVLAGLRGMGWAIALVGFATISTAWSQDAAVTLRKSVFLLLTSAFGVYFARRFPLDRQLQMICAAAAIVASLSIGLALCLPRYGLDHDVHEGAWVGTFTQKNVCAREMLFLFVCLLAYRPASRSMKWLRRSAMLGVLVVIGGSQSKTAYLMTLTMLCFVPMLRAARRMDRCLALAALGGVGAAFLAACALALSHLPQLLLLMGRDGTLSGRTAIWKAVLSSILKHPLLGYGYAAFWLSLRGESANVILALRWAVPAAHNGFLEIWLQVGALGLILFLLGFAQATTRAVRRFRHPSFAQAAWPLSILALTLVYNLDESTLMQANDFLWLLYVATLVNLASPLPNLAASFATLKGRSRPAQLPAA